MSNQSTPDLSYKTLSTLIGWIAIPLALYIVGTMENQPLLYAVIPLSLMVRLLRGVAKSSTQYSPDLAVWSIIVMIVLGIFSLLIFDLTQSHSEIEMFDPNVYIILADTSPLIWAFGNFLASRHSQGKLSRISGVIAIVLSMVVIVSYLYLVHTSIGYITLVGLTILSGGLTSVIDSKGTIA